MTEVRGQRSAVYAKLRRAKEGGREEVEKIRRLEDRGRGRETGDRRKGLGTN